jgi:hypothetical protein
MTQPQHAQRKHSRLAPSGASVWTVCTASPIYLEENEDRVVREDSVFSIEGTKGHEVADCFMRGQKLPAALNDATREMLDYGNAYKRYCASLHPQGLIDVRGVELSVPLFYLPEDNGHVDYLLMLPEHNTIHVVDYKYGKGVKVYAEENKQMSIYARSALEEYDLTGWVTGTTKVIMHIYQPRCRKEEGEGPASVWETTWDHLRLFTERDIAVPAHLIQERATHLLKFVPSDATCRWCPAAAWCDARAEQIVTGMPVVRRMTKAEPITPTPPEQITDENMAQVLAHIPSVRKWMDQVEEYAEKRAKAGNPVPGTKLVEGRGTRIWSVPALQLERVAPLGLDVYETMEPTLLSPFALEEKMKAAGVKKKDRDKVLALAVRTPGKPILAMSDDPRPEWQPVDALSEFSDLDAEDLL